MSPVNTPPPSTPSNTVPLPGVQAGSRLAQPVLDPRGGTLLAAGSILSESVIDSLQRRGIETVCVAVEGPEAEVPEVRPEDVKRRVEHLFRHSLHTDRINPLLHLVLHYRLQGLS